MIRRSSLPLCAALLFCGFVLGTGFESWLMPQPVEANALPVAEAARLYEELDNEENVLIESGRLLAKIARVTTPSVVHIQNEHESARRGTIEETGSGVIFANPKSSSDFYVVTNRHVVVETDTLAEPQDLKSITIHLFDGRVINPRRILTDRETDVAVLKISAEGLQPARWGDSDKLEIGHMVLAMGSPFGLSQSITYGIVSAKSRRSLRLGKGGAVLNQDFLQTDAAINPGNSGGPLIDLHGHVVGINTAIASNSGGNDGIGFSIPSNLVRRVAEQLLEKGKVQRAYLGVKLDPDFSDETISRLKLSRKRGARVVEVYTNTPASRANLQLDDIVVRFNGTEVQDENHLINLVSLTPVGSSARLEVIRGGRVITLEIKLSDRVELNQQ